MSLLLEQDQVILHGISWQTFQQLLTDRGERCGVLLAYNRGTVELRMPSQEHKWIKTTLTQVVDAIALARELHYRSLGSTTFNREDLDRGFEPDACFYLEHADAVTPEYPLDLETTPPPDLVIEVDITHSSLDKLPIYAALGIPEIWRYTNGKVEMRCLTEGTYTIAETSRVLPEIDAALVSRFIDEARTAPNQSRWFKNVMTMIEAQS